MKNWRALPSIGGVFGIVITSLLALGGLALLVATVILCFAEDSANANLGTFGVGLLSFVILAVAGLFGYRTLSYFRLRYGLDRNVITINLGNRVQTIPLANINHVLLAENVLDLLRQTPSPSPDEEDGSNPRRERVYARPRQASAEGNPSDAADSSAADSFIIQGDVVYEAKIVERDFSTAELDISEAEVIELEPDNLKNAADAGRNNGLNQEPSRTAYTQPEEAQIRTFKMKAKPFTSWLGFYDNRAWIEGLGEVQFYSTVPFAKTVIVRTDSNTYAISPREPQAFMTEYKLRRNLGATEEVVEGVAPGFILSHPLWRDKLGRGLLLGGLLLSLALFVFLFLIFDTLDPILRIHYNKFGEVDRLGTKGDIMWLPFIALLTFAANALFGAWVQVKDKVAAILLYSSTFAVQLMVWVAVFGILLTKQQIVAPPS